MWVGYPRIGKEHKVIRVGLYEFDVVRSFAQLRNWNVEILFPKSQDVEAERTHHRIVHEHVNCVGLPGDALQANSQLCCTLRVTLNAADVKRLGNGRTQDYIAKEIFGGPIQQPAEIYGMLLSLNLIKKAR